MKLHKMMAVGRAVGRNDIERIAALCQAALTLDPHDRFALAVLANAYWRNGLHDKALPLALRTLEITPNDFDALRIAVDAHKGLGNDEAAYLYAKLLCAAVPLALDTHDDVTGLLQPFVWIPRIDRLRQKALKEKQTEQTSRAQWIQWAQEYVAWYEAQSAPKQAGVT